MKTRMRLMASATIITALGLPSMSWGMEQASSENTFKLSGTNMKIESKSEFLSRSKYRQHEDSMDEYRNSVKLLYNELLKLSENQALSEKNQKEMSYIQAEIEILESKLAQSELNSRKEKNLDLRLVKEKIQHNIHDLENNIREIESRPKEFQHLFMKRKAELLEEVEVLKNKLKIIEKDEADRRKSIEEAGTSKIALAGDKIILEGLLANAANYTKIEKIVLEKEADLYKLYDDHIKGLYSSDIFSHDFIKIILENLGFGIDTSQLSISDTAYLFNLFARTLELPHLSVQTGEDKDSLYLSGLKTLSRNFTLRMQEDLLIFDFICRTLSFEINKEIQLSHEFSNNFKFEEDMDININVYIDLMMNVLSQYNGVVTMNSDHSELLTNIIKKSRSGVLGLCAASLENYLIKSGLDPEIELGFNHIMRINLEEFPNAVMENIYSIFGRHINKIALDKMIEIIESHSLTSITQNETQIS